MLIENIAYQLKRLQIQSAIDSRSFSENLHELKGLTYLLFEEFDSGEAKDLEKNLLEVLKVITKLGQQSKSKDFKKFIADPIAGDLSALKVPDPSDENAVSEFVDDVKTAAEEIAKIINVIDETQDMIGEPPEQGADQPIKDKAAKDKQTADQLIKGIELAYSSTPDWFTKAWGTGAKQAEKEAEGFFGKIKGFFTGLFKKKKKPSIKPEKVAEGILGITFKDLKAINTEAAKKALGAETKEVAADATGLTGAAIAQDSGGAGGAKDLEALAAKYKELIKDLSKEDPDAAKEELAEPAEELGLKPEELQGAIEDPTTLDDLAAEKEIDPEDVKAAIEDAAKDADPDVPLPNDEIEALDPTDEIEAAQDAGLTGPKAAIANMIKNWADSLSPTSKKSLATKGRGAALQQGIFDAIDATESELVGLVADAISTWRSEHEETLIRSKRFAKKNFASLEELIPKMVSDILKRTNESGFRITKSFIRKSVHRSLDVMFGVGKRSSSYLSELQESLGLPDDGDFRIADFLFEKGKKVKFKNSYKRTEFEDRLEKAFASEFPDFKGDVASLMAMAMGDYIKSEVDEIILEKKIASMILYEKYDFKAVSAYMKDQMGDLPEDAGISGDEDAVIADFLRSIKPILDKEGVEISGVPADSTKDKDKDEEDVFAAGLTDDQESELDGILDPLSDDFTGALEKDEEAALEKLEEPASAIGIEPDELALGLDDPQDLKGLIADEDLDPEEVITQLDGIKDDFSDEEFSGLTGEEEEDVEAALDGAGSAFEEEAAEDEEAALEKLEEPAAELGSSPEDLSAVLSGDEDVGEFISDLDLEPADVIDQLSAAEDALGGGEETEEPGTVTDDQKAELMALFDKTYGGYEKWSGESEEAALEKLEEPAQALEIPPEKLVDILDDDDPSELEDIIGDKELDTDAIIDTLEDAGKELEEEPPKGEDVKGKEDKEGKEEKEGKGKEEEAAEEDPEIAADPTEEIKAAADAGLDAKDSVAKALEDWAASLSKTSQDSLTKKKRAQSLQDAIFGAIDSAGEKIETAVAAAVASWRSENEETLLKSKRFAKKNFDSLEELIPKLAAAVLTKANENHVRRLTYTSIRKTVYNYLDRKFSEEPILHEFSRMNKLAGLIK